MNGHVLLIILGVLFYLFIGYIIVNLSISQNDDQPFKWSFKNIGCITLWLPLIIISYITLKLNKDKLDYTKRSKK